MHLIGWSRTNNQPMAAYHGTACLVLKSPQIHYVQNKTNKSKDCWGQDNKSGLKTKAGPQYTALAWAPSTSNSLVSRIPSGLLNIQSGSAFQTVYDVTNPKRISASWNPIFNE